MTGPAIGLTAWLATGSAASAQSSGSARIAAVANNKAITVLDVQSRLGLVFMSAGIPDNKETRKKLRPQILNQLIVEAIQLHEAARIGVSVSDREIARALAKIEKGNGMPSGQLLKILRRRNVNPVAIVDQVRASIAWTKVIRRIFASRTRISEPEIDEAIARLNANKDKLVYRILEIYIPFDRESGDSALRTTRRLIAQIRRGASFGGLARQFSQASTAGNGGDMGFVFEGQLPPELDAAIKRVKPGQVIGPVRTASGYYLLALVSKRPYGAGQPPKLATRRICAISRRVVSSELSPLSRSNGM
ncbi:MAG: peptidylprolyl isomerase [Rhodospirillaceae bacterium]|nr:peptidylprolyl isomerase [Rhodospirillaceae bacterium]